MKWALQDKKRFTLGTCMMGMRLRGRKEEVGGFTLSSLSPDFSNTLREDCIRVELSRKTEHCMKYYQIDIK